MNSFTGIEITKAHREDFDGIKWVLRTLDKDSYLYKRICFEDGYCIGTDGHRLHIYEYVDEYKNGVYEKILNTAGKIVLKFIPDQKYLDWKSIHTTAMKPQELKLIESNYPSIEYSNLIRKIDPSVTIQFPFFDDLVRSTWSPWTVYIYGATDGVWFMAERRIALIMPMHTIGYGGYKA